MGGEVALDTDVLLKAAAFRLSAELCSLLAPIGPPAILGLTHLIAAKQLNRISRIADKERARVELEKALALLGQLEPDDDEIALAAEISAAAQIRGLPLDSGEAQLMAILIHQELPLVVTGDKRALTSLSVLIRDGAVQGIATGRLVCFEQIIARLGELMDVGELRAKVCAEPGADGAMSIIFCCGRETWDSSQFTEGCASYIRHLREEIGGLLADDSTLT